MATQINFCKGMLYNKTFTKTRPIISVDDVEDAVKHVEGRQDLFEVMKGRQITKVYFDFDKTTDKEDATEIKNENDNNIHHIIDYMCDGYITKEDIAIAQRHRWLNKEEFKISFRYYIPKLSTYYPDIKQWLIMKGCDCLFDTSVYKESEQLLGCIHNLKKLGDTVPLTPITNHNTKDFIVQIVPPDSQLMTIPIDEETPKEKMKQDKEEVSIEHEILRDVVMNLEKSRSKYYETWTKVVWGIYNIEKDEAKRNELIHDFSKLSKNYNKNKVDDFIDKHCKYTDDGIGLGTLLTYLEEDNEDMFKIIKSKINPTKKVSLTGYSILDIEEPSFDIFDGKTREYSVLKAEFEKRHFKVMRPVIYVEELKNGDFYMRSPKDLNDAFKNVFCTINEQPMGKFLKLWLDDPTIRKFETIEFLPPPLHCPCETFNMWRGFAIERKNVESSENIQPFLDHLSILVNHDEKCIDYLVKWFSHIIQYPGILNGISVCIVSAQGAGKNVFLDFFHKILGKELFYETANPVQDLWSRFSVGRKNRLLINIDETSGKDTYPYAEQIKNMLTSPNYNYEQKGVNPITLNNFNRVVFTSNNLNPVKITEEERRNFVVKASDEKKGNKEYFDNLIAYFKDEANQKAVFDYLKSIDLSKVDWINDRPITEIYKDIQETNIKIEIKFFKWLVDTNSIETELEYSGMSLFEHYHEFLDKCKYPSSFSMNNTVWGRCIKPYIDVFIKKTRTKTGIGYKIKVGDVKNWLIEKKYITDYMIQDGEIDDDEY